MYGGVDIVGILLKDFFCLVVFRLLVEFLKEIFGDLFKDGWFFDLGFFKVWGSVGGEVGFMFRFIMMLLVFLVYGGGGMGGIL